MLTLITALSAVPAAAAAQGHDHASPYVDLRDREVKALSADDVDALLAGEGMGFALTAELNGYPGPKHVLELADSLELTAEQRERTLAVMDAMAAEARELGARLVDAERSFDQAFAEQTIRADRVREAARAIGALRGELRAVHLAAHLSMMQILTRHQRHVYQELRGYGVAHDHHARETG
ncbi:MAG: Spy/CpxP family protein refolding chaperone [Gemmatimonadota bacterium]